MACCGNMLELVEKHKILDEEENFVKWTDFEENFEDVEVYIEKVVIPELIDQEFIIIDAAVGNLQNGEKFGMLFIKKDENVYHSIMY